MTGSEGRLTKSFLQDAINPIKLSNFAPYIMWDIKPFILDLSKEQNFNDICIKIFHFQYVNNVIYQKYVNLLQIKPQNITHFSEIPFLPIDFFKTNKVITGEFSPECIFKSSSTTGLNRSKHFIKNISFYHENAKKCFEHFFSDLKNYIFLGLLPNYLEQGDSSLVSMVDFFTKNSQNSENNYYLYNHEALFKKLHQFNDKNVILFGVSYALLDFAENFNGSFPNLTIIETGGMKGRKKELTKDELYHIIRKSFPNSSICSEYGMTELTSQAYTTDLGIYQTVPWMKVLIRSADDPFAILGHQKQGAINIIDLANINSCCFIATDDIGKTIDEARFEISGRLDYSDIRGCSQLVI